MGKHLVQNEKKKKGRPFEADLLDEDIAVEDELGAKPKKVRKAERSSGIASIVLSALLLAVIPLCPLESWMLKAAYAVALLIAALEIIWDVLDNINAKKYFANENTILLASVLAFSCGRDLEAVLMLILFRITKLVFSGLEARSREQIKSFGKMAPDKANVETLEGILTVEPDLVNVGEIIHIGAGETVALDGVIIEGISTIDTSMISGQSTPWAVNEGHRVYSGCRNITSPIRVKVTRPYKHSTFSNLLALVNSAQDYLSRQEKFCVKLSKYYGVTLFTAAVLVFVSISLVNGQWLQNLERASALLAAASFSLLLVCIAACYSKGAGVATENGIFVKGSDCIESMARAETMVFDKTGIVTEGRYIITDVFPNKVSEHELLTIAATAERFSRHPIAAALRDAAGKIEIDYKSLQIEEIPGRGISAFVGDKQVYVGNTSLLEEHGIKCAVPSRPGAAIHVAVDYKYWGHILITDRIRRGAFDALENLRAMGAKKMVLLTGDVLSVAKPLASKLNFDMLRAELRPAEKASAVEFLMTNRGDSSTLAFIGDGNSDEQIMSRVDIGLAMGALGSDAAFNAADVLIMDRDIKKLPAAFKLSKLTYNVAMINILVWLIINALLIVLSALAVLPLIIVVIAEFLLACTLFLNTQRIK